MLRFGIFAVLWSVVMYSFGFTMDRSAFVSSTWDTAPSLDTYQKVFIDPALNNKMQVTGMDKILQAENTKTEDTISIRLTEKMLKNQTREKKSMNDNIETEIKLINDISNSSEENVNTTVTLRNVILLLIDERSQGEKKKENSWNDYEERLPFAIKGFLQNCRNNIETEGLSSDTAPISGNKEKECDCERILRSNIEELLSWARQAREMTIGTVSGSNFSIPFFPKYEFNGSNESDTKLELHKSKRDSNDANWQMIDISDRAKSVPTLIRTNPKTKGMTNYEDMWDVFDVFSKIRTAFFRSLLESLSKNDGTSDDKFSSRKPSSLKSTVTNLIGNTIKELKSIPNDKGYMLIATVPRSERAVAVDLLQREISPKDTLLIVTQICAEDKKSVPFVALGPNNQILQEARAVVELPIAIRKAIASDCHDQGCANQLRRDVPIVSHVPIEIFSQELLERKRVARNNDAVKKPETSQLNDTNVRDTVNTKETTTIGKEKQGRSLTSLQTIPYNFAITLGVTTSILTMPALTSC